MEKLKKLLNEYEGQDDWYIEYLHTRDTDIPQMCCNYIEESHSIIDSYIISKQFGFIKRLVKNDKIDLSKLVEYEFDKLERFIQRKHNALLMLLSIQDNPIEFLISVLK